LEIPGGKERVERRKEGMGKGMEEEGKREETMILTICASKL